MQNETRSTSPFTQPSHGQQNTPHRPRRRRLPSGTAEPGLLEPSLPEPSQLDPSQPRFNQPECNSTDPNPLQVRKVVSPGFKDADLEQHTMQNAQPDMIEAMSPPGCSRHCMGSGQQFRHWRGEAAATTQLYDTAFVCTLFLIVFFIFYIKSLHRHKIHLRLLKSTLTYHPSNYIETLCPSKRNTYEKYAQMS